MLKRFLLLSVLFPLAAFGQTSPFHRIGQVLTRGSGVSVSVVPYANILVCTAGSNPCTAASIYSNVNLTTPITGSVVADSSGNFSYYMAGNQCVDEYYSAPGIANYEIPNICSSFINNNVGTSTNGQFLVNDAGAVGGLNASAVVETIQTGTQTMSGPLANPEGFIGNLTGGASLDLPLTGGTMSGSLQSAFNGAYTLPNNTTEGGVAVATDGTSLNVWAGNNASFNGVIAGITVPSGATNWQNNGLAGIVQSNSTSSSVNAVGIYGQAVGLVNGARVWGGNFLVDDAAGESGASLAGNEIDIGLYGAPAAVYGLHIAGNSPGGATMPSNSYAVEIGAPSSVKWNYGLNFDDGSINTAAVVIPATGSTASSASSPINFRSYSSGDALGVGTLNTDSSGNLIFQTSFGTGAAFIAPQLQVKGLTGWVYCNGSSGNCTGSAIPVFASGLSSDATINIDTSNPGTSLAITPAADDADPAIGVTNHANTVYVATISDVGTASFAGNVTAANGTNVVYRCTTAGTLPIGAMTIAPADCGASTDTGLRVK